MQPFALHSLLSTDLNDLRGRGTKGLLAGFDGPIFVPFRDHQNVFVGSLFLRILMWQSMPLVLSQALRSLIRLATFLSPVVVVA